jgi:D-alanine transaminase
MQVFLNGEFVPREQAKISVFDRGFLFGDGVYEVIPVFNNKLFRFNEHLQRLNNSLTAINISNPYRESEWEETAKRLIAQLPVNSDKAVYIEVTRGVAEREHLYSEGMVPTVFIMCNPIEMKRYDTGISAITHPDIRWKRCDIKAITLLPNILLRQLAKDTDGSYDAILLMDGKVTEGTASNVFVVKDNLISTPPKDKKILPGVTRDLLVELLRQEGIPCKEKIVKEVDLTQADEIWLTGSTTGVAPVVKLNGIAVADGLPGKWWKQASRHFHKYIESY